MAVICVSETTVKDAGVPPNVTPVAPVKLLPVIVTVVPPAAGPVAGLTPVTLGITATYVNDPPGLEVPDMLLTQTETVPAEWGGLVVVICVSETTVNDAGVPPNVTPVAPVKLLPEIVTEVPPVVGPLEGNTPVTLGITATYVNDPPGLEVPERLLTHT